MEPGVGVMDGVKVGVMELMEFMDGVMFGVVMDVWPMDDCWR
jgi:hypothetical protein